MIPQTLSHYRVLEKIGAGGMGVVYRAHDEQLDRDVALKVLPPGTLSDEKARQRFRREALALAKLNHPNVGAVYEFGSEAGVDFLVMELVSGVTLDTKLTGGPLQEQEVLRLGAQLADGLDAAHTQGIIHRDLKPGNLRLTSDGRLKILDFGLAQWTQEEDAATVTATLTKGSDVSGTVPYMAPELLRGHLADARTDVYAAGAVLYELATGKRPFPDVTGPQLIGAILERQPSALTSRNHRISPALESIVLKALDKDPNRRYQSARELRVDLERLSTGVVPVIRRGRPPWVWAVPAVIAAALLIALAANVGGWRDRWFKHSPPTSSSVGGKTRRSVAVLGFKNLSGRPEAAWISTAIAEMLTTELAAGEQLRTVPGENVARMKQDLALSDADSLAPDTLARIHQHLGSDLVILGSYLALGKENGGKLRLDFRLQDAVAGETIATVSETATESELIDLVSRTGAELRSKLGVGEVSPDEASGVLAALPSNPDAARLYSEGLDKLRVFETLAGRDLLAAAVAKEPDFAPAHSALSGAWSALGYDAKAQDEAKKAFDLSQGLPRESRLAVEGRYRDAIHDWPKAVEIYNTLFGFFPDNLEYGLRLATAQVSAGKGKEAMATLTALHGLPAPEGDDPRIDLAESKAANSLGDFKQAQESAAKAAGKGRARGSKLLVAQARAAEGGALERLGKSDQATAALTEAQTQFSEAGDKLGAALAVHTAGNVMYDQGNFAGARKNYLQAYEVFRQLGTQSRASSSLNNLGNVCYELGDLECARQYYQQTLDTDREIEDKSGAAGALGNLGNVLDGMGRLAESRKMQEAGLEAFRAIGDKRGTASTLTNFGNLLVEIGDLEGARAKYEEAIQIQTETGHKRGQAYALYGLANVLTAQANLQEARKRAGQCASIRHETGEQSNAAASDTQLANIALEEGRAAEAVALTRPAAQQFEKDNVSQNAASAYALLALALLAENKTEEARQSADRAVSMAQQTVDKAPRFEAAIAKARVDATSDPGAALKLLEATRAEAAKFGYVPYELEARLAMGEIEMKSGKAAGRSRLDALEKDAKAKGYLLVAQKAAKGRG